MKLNEKIITLRSWHQMSQGDLAEKLNVSRQSVSKWETGASIPDLDKLIAMSELFQVTMDELTKENVELERKEQEASKEDQSAKKEAMAEQYKENVYEKQISNLWLKLLERRIPIIRGLSLIILSIYFEIFRLILTNDLRVMLIPGYLFLCGLICIFSKKHTGRRILILTLAIVVIGIVLTVSSFAVAI